MTELVSILIPCYNAEQWVAAAIQSALDQTHANKEVIVVDDGSTDGSLRVIQSFGDKIRWETGPNRGGNAARNRLLELANGEWVQYLDADDYLLPSKVAVQLNEAESVESADVLWSPSIYEYWEEGGEPRQEVQQLSDEDPWVALIRWRLPQTGAALWKKQAITDVGGWKTDQPRCQEHELYFRLLQAGKQFQFCPSALSVYRQWSNETVCRKDPLATTKTRMEIVTSCEQFLQSLGQESVYASDIFATRIQCARAAWASSRSFAKQLAASAEATHRKRTLPPEPWFPVLYRNLYATVGFQAAELIAASVRSLKHGAGMK